MLLLFGAHIRECGNLKKCATTHFILLNLRHFLATCLYVDQLGSKMYSLAVCHYFGNETFMKT